MSEKIVQLKKGRLHGGIMRLPFSYVWLRSTGGFDLLDPYSLWQSNSKSD